MTALLAATVGSACNSGPHAHHPAGMQHGFANADEASRVFDDPARDAWQRPDDVLSALSIEPAMTVADVGAGTGYFAVRLARAIPSGRVIAIDIEPGMVRHLEARAQRERLPNLSARLSTSTASGLAARSVDRILVVHVWHHLANRVAYARDLAAALRPGGKLVIVEFPRDAQRGPPAELRVAPETIVAELATAGLSAKISSVSIPDQYIVEAWVPVSPLLSRAEGKPTDEAARR